MLIKNIIFSCILLFQITTNCSAQINQNSKNIDKQKKFYKSELFKASIVPVVLIGWGISTIHGHGLYSSNDAYRDIHTKLHLKKSHIDDYLQYAPFAELLFLNALKIKCKNDLVNTGLLILKSEILMNGIIWPLKLLTHEIRPDSIYPEKTQSFPSGHASNAFLAASIIHKEFKHKSVWYGIMAYTIAGTVGLYRMVNNRHWESDVFVGAGIGILSVHLSYLTHKYRWGKKCDLTIIPNYNNKNFGLTLYKKI